MDLPIKYKIFGVIILIAIIYAAIDNAAMAVNREVEISNLDVGPGTSLVSLEWDISGQLTVIKDVTIIVDDIQLEIWGGAVDTTTTRYFTSVCNGCSSGQTMIEGDTFTFDTTAPAEDYTSTFYLYVKVMVGNTKHDESSVDLEDYYV